MGILITITQPLLCNIFLHMLFSILEYGLYFKFVFISQSTQAKAERSKILLQLSFSFDLMKKYHSHQESHEDECFMRKYF